MADVEKKDYTDWFGSILKQWTAVKILIRMGLIEARQLMQEYFHVCF